MSLKNQFANFTGHSPSKLAENSFRDVNIAYANELDCILNELNIDTTEVIRLANLHPRVNILNPGPGVGGHCIPVDPYFLSEKSKKTNLILLARKINDRHPQYIVDKILKSNYSRIGLLGFAYKGNTADLRNSPSLEIYSELIKKDVNVKGFDPYINYIQNVDLAKIRHPNSSKRRYRK